MGPHLTGLEPSERQYEELGDAPRVQQLLAAYQDDYNASGKGRLDLGEWHARWARLNARLPGENSGGMQLVTRSLARRSSHC